MDGKFPCRKCAGGALHRERVGPCRHGQDEMKGIAHGGLRRDQKSSLLPFSFQVCDGLFVGDDLSILIFDIEWPIPWGA